MRGSFRLIGILTLVAGTAIAADYKPPRLPNGAPDLQGLWTNGSATPFERESAMANKPFYTEAEAKAIRQEAQARLDADAKPSDPNAKIEAGALPPVGNYNLFWTERGDSPVLINGEYRTSMVIDPPNGRVPPLTKEAQDRRRNAPRVKTAGMADGPEQRSLGERCILSFGSSAGPPMLPTMYNSTYQIYQSDDTVVFLAEMVHDARIVRIGSKHGPSSVKKWMGDSVGHWDGDTLVVVTKNIRPEQGFRGTSADAVFTERFTRVAADKIVYRLTVDDPKTFTAPWTAELTFDAYDGNVFEYACHEGNYSLPGIMLGARKDEDAAAAKKAAEKKK
jgi:hypothetical protein